MLDILILVAAVSTAAVLLVAAHRDPGLSRRQRVTRWVNAIGLCALAIALLVFARTATEWASFVVLAVITAWVLTVLVLSALHRIEQVRGRRTDATLGVPATPAPMSTTRAFVHWVVWSVGGGTIALLGVVAIGVLFEPQLTLSVLRLQDSSKLVLAVAGAVMVAAGIGVLLQKLARDEAVRYHRALTDGIAARLRAERSAGYDRGYADAVAGTAMDGDN